MATDSGGGNDLIERKLIGIGNEVFSTGALGEGKPDNPRQNAYDTSHDQKKDGHYNNKVAN